MCAAVIKSLLTRAAVTSLQTPLARPVKPSDQRARQRIKSQPMETALRRNGGLVRMRGEDCNHTLDALMIHCQGVITVFSKGSSTNNDCASVSCLNGGNYSCEELQV